MSGDPLYDALIIGGGPGGSSAGTFLAQTGRKVLLLEKEVFPRFHIGESLLPYNHRLFHEMGVMPALAAAGFPVKQGAQFHLGNGSKSVKLVFAQGKFTREPKAFQVERSRFDELLLRHAARTGCEVREGWTVNRVEDAPDARVVHAANSVGETSRFRARFVIDASGRSNLTGNQEGLRQIHPRLKKVAIFGHFHGVRVDDDEKAGDTVIIRLENKWFWLIPLSREKVSVGCVLDQEELRGAPSSIEDFFNAAWQSSPAVRERMAGATPAGPIQVTSDFSYSNRRLIGSRLLRVGDAAGFMDPIFSAGVYLAMHSGKLAAQTVSSALDRPETIDRSFAKYEKRVFGAMRFYGEMVEHFYTTPFMEVFLEPREKFQLASAVNAALAGEVEGGWRLRWRMRLFFWIVKLQRRFPLVPRLTFAESSSPAVPAASSGKDDAARQEPRPT
jgi:flavin-dependent dehydrogenase